MQHPNPETITLNDILMTEALSQRAPRSPAWQAEAEAMRSLAQQMARDSQSLMQALADTAVELCQAGTAGVSLLEAAPDGEEIFRWTVLAGTLAHHLGGTSPRDFSPCGVCLAQGSPVLFSHPERYFTYFQAANTPIVEGLVLPLVANSHVLGTIWIMSHDEGRQFDSEDVRVMTILADFTATALLLQQRQTRELLAANAALETEIVERKLAQEQTNALISHLPGGAVFVVDRDLRYVLAAGEALAIAGLKPENFVGRTIFEALLPELATSYEPIYRKCLAGEPFEHEHHAHARTYISRGTPLFDANGEVYAVIAISYDITDRKRAEEALCESEEKYRSLFNSMDEGYAVVEVLADDHGEWNDFLFLEVNPAFEQQTGMVNSAGRKATEILGTPNPAWAKIYGRVAETGEPVRFEENEATLDRVFDLYAFRLGGAGSCRVAVLFTDITDRKQKEVILRENAVRQAFLLKLSDILQQFVQPNDIKAAAMCLLGEHLGVSRAQYHECDSSGEYYSADGVGYANGLPLLDLKYRIDAFGTFVNEDFAAGRPYRSDDLTVDPRVSAEEREAYRTYQIRAGAGVPLIRGGKLVAILAIHDVHPHPWTDLEMDLIRETAERIWTPVERARAEAALRDSEQRLSVIFAQAAVGLSEISLDGHFERVNDAFCQMLGRSRQELLAATIPEVTHPEDAPKSLDALAQLLETGESISLNKRYLRPDGTVLWANSILTRLDDEQGQPYRILAVTLDVGDRKQAEAERLQRIQEQAAREEERQRAETLAELDRAKTLFFSNISHEFRTPLTLILAPLQEWLASLEAQGSLPPHPPIHPSTLKHNLQLAHRNALRLQKLVNTLLDFSRIEAGRMNAVYEPTDLAQFTTDLASVFRSAIERAGLRFTVDCPPLPEPVYVDREMWEKIVLNLLSNALKFTASGEITVSLHPEDSRQAIFQIQDTGSGIAPEHLPHLFERFYQVRGGQGRTCEGSGIGLALVHELIGLQGGAIAVSSTVGEGTCFTITLPFGTQHLPPERIQAARSLTSTAIGADFPVDEAARWLPEEGGETGSRGARERERGQASESLAPQPPRVLIVDDNADMRQYLTHILSRHVHVEAAADGAAALAAIQAQVPDLVLSDVMMPRLDGFGLLQALRAAPPTREIPVILLSARAGEEAITEGLDAGADDYLIKPFTAQELISRVNAHLQMASLRKAALQEAKTTLRQKDELLSVASHELNTPLVSILGWARLLRANPQNGAMLSTALDSIEHSATLQAKLVQDLLDASRMSAGKLRVHLQPLDLESVVEAAIATVTQSASEKEIPLTWTETVIARVMGDRERLQQVVCNLLTNAIKFTPQGGRVEVRLSLVPGQETLAGDREPAASNVSQPTINRYAEIGITDTGIGIAADFLPHVFEQFRQAEGKNSAKGLGLGLAIAHHIVELHNGTIEAKSAGAGKGTTLIVRLPLLTAAPPEKSPMT
jgi:PAS domain S-box-containing protein